MTTRSATQLETRLTTRRRVLSLVLWRVLGETQLRPQRESQQPEGGWKSRIQDDDGRSALDGTGVLEADSSQASDSGWRFTVYGLPSTVYGSWSSVTVQPFNQRSVPFAISTQHQMSPPQRVGRIGTNHMSDATHVVEGKTPQFAGCPMGCSHFITGEENPPPSQPCLFRG